MHAADAKKPISATITATDPVSGARGTAHILVEKSQPVTMSKEQEYEANAAYYESTRQSQLEAAAKVHASFREGIPKMSRTEIDSQWDAEKEDFIAVAASPTHGLKREQLLQIWLRYWSDRYKASQVERAQIADLKPNERSAALKRQDTDEKLANFMIRSAPLVNEYLIAAEVEGKHVTLDELNKAAAKLEGFHEAWVSALGMVVASGEGTGGGPRQEVVPPVKAKEPSTGAGGGGTEPPTGGRGGGPSRPPSQTIKASPPPPPQQASRPGAPTPVTDVEVMKTNVGSPASIRTQSPGPHQTDWTARGGTGKAPAAYRDSDGIVHVSTDHPLMGSPNRGGIPPVRPGDTTQPGPTPPHTQPAPSSTLSDKAPTPAKPPVDPGARTQAAPAKAAPVPKNAPTGGAAAESKREQAPRGHIDPPQEVSRQVVENIRNRPRTVDPRRKGSGSNVSYTTDHEAHELAWKRLGGHGDSPPAFIYDNQVYLDPSRWKD